MLLFRRLVILRARSVVWRGRRWESRLDAKKHFSCSGVTLVDMDDTCAYINGLGICLPNQPIENDQIENVLGSLGRVSKLVKRRILINNGIKGRYFAIDPATGKATHSNSQLTAEAIRAACRDGELPFDQIDCLATGTSSPDQLIPGHANMVQAELGCGPCDVATMAGVCCSGMVAFKYGYLHVLSGMGPNAVVAGSELASAALRASRFQHQVARHREELQRQDLTESDIEKQPAIAFRNDFLRWMLSDGAGAALIERRLREDQPSLRIDWMDSYSYAHDSETCMYSGMVKQPDGSARGFRQVDDPDELYRTGVLDLAQDVDILQDRLPVLIKRALAAVRDKRGLQSDSIDWLLPHYSSKWFREPLFEALIELEMPIPYERWFTNLPTKGNTGAASIYIILEELVASGKLKHNDRLFCIVPESARMSFFFLHLTVCMP